MRNLGRLEISLSAAMIGFLADWGITRWILVNYSGFAESNVNLFPEVGLPLLVLGYILGDFLLPRVRLYDNILYTLPVLQWTGPVQNVFVLLNLVKVTNFFYTVPVVLLGTFLILHFDLPSKALVWLKPTSV